MKIKCFSVNAIILVIIAMLTMFAFVGGCRTGGTQVDPLAGWHACRHQSSRYFDKELQTDLEAYITSLPGRQRDHIVGLTFCELNGQHAVRITIALNGSDWAHVLIYDKNNKRIKVVKYVSNSYSS
jgi:hypothetical protein